jgi:type IV secretion system protein VirB9
MDASEVTWAGRRAAPRSAERAVLGAIMLIVGLSPALAERTPTPGRYDPRIRTIVYERDNVVRLAASFGISTMIVLSESEQIETITVGDTAAWQVTTNKRKTIIFLKPVEKDANTNLNVVTSKRIYTFDLRATETKAARSQIFKVRFVYPEDDYDARLLTRAREIARSPTLRNLDVANLNTDYAYKGSEAVKPATVFDDGLKTWFKFMGDMPAIFLVNADRSETLVNGRREREYYVVDKVGFQWTLRAGAQATCVFNLRNPATEQRPSADGLAAPRRIESGFFGSRLGP